MTLASRPQIQNSFRLYLDRKTKQECNWVEERRVMWASWVRAAGRAE